MGLLVIGGGISRAPHFALADGRGRMQGSGVMQTGFFGKIVLVILAGFAMACLVQFYRTFIEGADRAMQNGLRQRGGLEGR